MVGKSTHLDKNNTIQIKDNGELKECQNCGYKDRGNFCSNCGQSFAALNRPMKDILAEVGDIANFDSRIFRSIPPFLFKPGFLTREYLAGKRKKYMSPFRLYILMSLLFFFLAQSTSKKITEAGDNWLQVTADTTDAIRDDSTVIEFLRNDSIFKVDIDSTALTKSIRKAKRSKRLREGAIAALTNKTNFIRNFYRTISYVLFLLMPVFALLLKMLYIRRRVFYIEHLMFSINMHSFMLLVFSMMIIIGQIVKEHSGYVAYIFILVPVYFTAGMKRFYRQALWKILFKEMILAGIYLIILLLSLLVAGYITLYFF
jgi:hypothetical protein